MITNTGPEDLTITSLSDDIFGDLDDPTNPEVAISTCLNAGHPAGRRP